MLGVDLQGSSDPAREESLSSELVGNLQSLVRQALKSQGIGSDAYSWQNRGDGGRFDFHDVSPVRVIEAVTEQVPSALRRHNRRVAQALRMALRFVVHEGYVVPHEADRDHNGRAVQDLSGILDSPELREALRRRGDWVLAVTEPIWNGVVLPRHGDLDPGAFEASSVRVKSRGVLPVWITPRGTGAARPDPAAASRPTSHDAPSGGVHGSAEPPRVSFGAPVTFDGITSIGGTQYIGGQSDRTRDRQSP
ncbi:hypothetical protein ACQEVI_24930 [Promicromonospora sp. CA-289599]|uniref:hypothetical protein n=1 Tax=Promicromonospora sp. CA-289599 TaxID=3240014 RepID=UPI003D8DBEBA